jgi:hypothetical protein
MSESEHLESSKSHYSDNLYSIPDIEVGDTLFSDGCGLMSLHYARLLARQKRIIFRQQKYTPCVIQIR